MTPQRRPGRLSWPADLPLAAGSILGFWLFYLITVVGRALFAPDPAAAIAPRLASAAGGALLTGLIYLAICAAA